ncbi:MAG: hypothetical protein ACK5H2_08830 [Beutenbergiaceae bacterium]
MTKLLAVAALGLALTGCNATEPTSAPSPATLSCPDGYPDGLSAALGDSRSGDKQVEILPDTAAFLEVPGPVEPQDGCFVVVIDGEQQLRMGLVPGDGQTLHSLGQAMEASGLTPTETGDNVVADASYTTPDGVQYILMDREETMGSTNLFSQTFGSLFEQYFPADQELIMIVAIVGA